LSKKVISVPFRRKREGKTNYYKRKKLLLSKKPRLVVRKSNKYIRCQVITYDEKGDRTIVDVTSKTLSQVGVKALKNTRAAYLTGYLCGKKYLSLRKKTECVLDIGLQRPVNGCKVYAALKGFIDAGANVPHDPKVFPSQERISAGKPEELEKIKQELDKLAITKKQGAKTKTKNKKK